MRLRHADRASSRVEVLDDKSVTPVLILQDRHALQVLGVLVVRLKEILRHPDNYQGQRRPNDSDELEPAQKRILPLQLLLLSPLLDG